MSFKSILVNTNYYDTQFPGTPVPFVIVRRLNVEPINETILGRGVPENNGLL